MTLPRKNSDVVRDGCRRYDRKVVPVFSTVTVAEAAGQGTTEQESLQLRRDLLRANFVHLGTRTVGDFMVAAP